ncbi:MAG: hypothetical protein ACK413_01455 [Patescibacteria group bacterium]
MSSKNKKLLIGLVIIIVIMTVSWLISYQQRRKIFSGAPSGCLRENETVSYEIKRKENAVSTADIIVINKNNNKEKYRFQIELPLSDHYHPIEIHRCGVYAVRSFNYDYNIHTSLPGYKTELWKYDYKGNGEKIILLAEDILGNLKGYKYFFSSDFRVDSQEKYIVLIKNYPQKEDYSLVIKDLATKEDVFVLLAKSISQQYPNIVGVFDMLKWTNDSRYFWGSISDGAYVNGYFRIDTQNWKVDIFEAPEGAMGGSDLNVNTGYLTIQPGQVWTGFSEIEEELKEEYRKEGKKSSLYIYNLFSKEKILIDETDEPLWWFEAEWLSDNELQYKMPNGEKKIYRLNNI